MDDLKKLILEKEKDANVLIAKRLAIFGIIIFCVGIVFKAGFWVGNQMLVNIFELGGGLAAVLVGLVILEKKGEGRYCKFLLFSTFLILNFGINIISGFSVWLIYAIPLCLTLRYLDKWLTTVIFILSEIGIFLSAIINSYGYRVIGYLDLNTVVMPAGTTIQANGELFKPVVEAMPDSRALFFNTLKESTIGQFVAMAVLYVVCMALQNFFVSVMVERENAIKQKAEMELEVANSRSRIMLSQIQPHFLYNALQAIMAIDGNPDETIDAIGDFGKYLRENLDVITSGDMVPFEKELTHVQRYVSLEELRFGDKVCVEYDIQATNFSIPAMTVQMMVENAIKHGVSKKQYGGTVHVLTREEENCYMIRVEDDGLGFDKSKGKPQDGRSHVGLENIEARLRNLCNGTFEIDSVVGEGTTAIVRIPK